MTSTYRAATATPATIPAHEAVDHRRRATFSARVKDLTQVHTSAQQARIADHHARRNDDLLRLIDNLTSRAVDPMFSDARLVKENVPKWAQVLTHLIVFVICVSVGCIGTNFVRALQSDPRRIVRESLTEQVEHESMKAEKISQEINETRESMSKLSLAEQHKPQSTIDDEMLNGLREVSGPGVVVTMTNPVAQSETTGGDQNTAARIRLLTDLDLQQMINLLWHAGAEAIALNGNRIGVQTSIRLAGQSILVGVTPVESPYKLQVIGSSQELSQAISEQSLPELFAAYETAGITIKVSKQRSMSLPKTTLSDITYAKRSE